ncbi:HNH endonuclease [Marinobacter sp. 71-i]|uniref:HNH endonuclease n=1 Tax=Marinobacter iranensis TaxID=2962607 RepID=A0ABT5Y9J1_9GAMM|nr:HNH endonuclease [Marinobacter iranensis]MDF0750346.1 HNH endonuclease [Marinobacter iranensis]
MKLAKDIPSQAELRKIFDYNPETGDLVWLRRPEKGPQWNGRFAGKVAGTPHKAYIRVKLDGEKYQAHRLIWMLVYGEIPNDKQVDHEDGIGNHNRLSNLRLVSNQQNQFNRSCDKGRGYKGVYPKGKRWKAEITTPDGRQYLGMFNTPEQAAVAYDTAARKWHGEHARLNFPNVHEVAA